MKTICGRPKAVSHKGECTEGEINATPVKTVVRRYFTVPKYIAELAKPLMPDEENTAPRQKFPM
jgi:hypothetical protein